MELRVGTAGWTIPGAVGDQFPSAGTHLERYARVLNASEINSCFHRAHRAETYAKWSASVPADFRFAVKLRRTITHDLQLKRCGAELTSFIAEIAGLGEKLGPLLVQLPPKLEFSPAAAKTFFRMLRARHTGPVVCEPRHASWFSEMADEVLRQAEVARVAADPARVPAAGRPGGFPGNVYFRLHGSPRMYYSSYSPQYIDELAGRIRCCSAESVWCIFDNTASGAGLPNALELHRRLGICPQ